MMATPYQFEAKHQMHRVRNMGLVKLIAGIGLAAYLLNCPALAADRPASTAELEKLEEQLRGLDKDLSVLKATVANQLDAQDKRIQDIGLATAQQANYLGTIANATASVGNYIGWTSLAIGLAVGLLGWFTYRDAKKQAKEEAERVSKQWFEENEKKLSDEFERLKAEVTKTLNSIAEDRQKVELDTEATLEHNRTMRDKVASAEATILQPKDEAGITLDFKSVRDANTVVQVVSESLKTKPEQDFSPDEHYARGLARFADGDYTTALASFESALAGLPSDASPAEIARYLLAQGSALDRLGRLENALEVFDELDRRFGGDSTPTVRELVARGLNNKAVTLDKLNRHQEEIAVYDDLDQRFRADPRPRVHVVVLVGLLNKGIAYGKLRQFEDAIKVYDELDRRVGANSTQEVRLAAITGLINKGATLGILGRTLEEIAVYEDLDRRFGSDPTPGIPAPLIIGLLNKGASLTKLGQFEEAKAIYDDIDRRFGEKPTPEVRGLIAKGIFNKAVTNGNLGRPQEELALYDEIDRRFGADPTPAVREQVVKAIINKGATLVMLNQTKEAIAVFDDLDRRFGGDPMPEVRKLVVTGLVAKGARLTELGRTGEAKSVYDDLDRRFGTDPITSVRRVVAKGLLQNGVTLTKRAEYEEAIAVFDKLDRRFGADTNPGLHEIAVQATNGIGFSQLMLAKARWNDEIHRQQLLSQAKLNLNRALSDCVIDDRAMVVGNLGYVLHLNGEHETARTYTLESLTLGRQQTLDAQRDDARQHRVEPEDTQYEMMLDELWRSLTPLPIEGE